jgi:hypothetical protein
MSGFHPTKDEVSGEILDVNIVSGSSAGTEYTEGDTDASITGTAILWEDAGNTLTPVSASKPLPVEATLDTTGLATEAKQDTIIGHVDGIETALTAANASLDGIEASASVLDDWDESDRAKVNPIAGQAGVAGGSGTVGATTQRVVLATDVALPAGTNALGKLLPPDIDVATHTNYARKYYTNAGAVTDGIIWSPAAGKRWHVVTMYIQVSADATVTLEDDKVGGDEAVFKSEFKAGSGTTVNWSEKYPLASGEDAADLLITTSAGNVYVTITGYEI